jgi:hypothetical protein
MRTLGLRNRSTQLALGLILAGIFCAVLMAQGTPKGEWRAEFQTGGEQLWLQIHWEAPGETHTWGSTWQVSELWGMDPNMSIGTHANAHFELRRDAGTIAFTGDFDKGIGTGTIQFSPSAEFVQGMKGMGYANLSSEQLFAMTEDDVSRTFVQQMKDLGYRDLSADTLITLKRHGVTVEFATGMRGLGLKDLSVDQL